MAYLLTTGGTKIY